MTRHQNRSRVGKQAAVATAAVSAPKTPRASRTRQPIHNHEIEYPLFENVVRGEFAVLSCHQLFTTDVDVDALWGAYLGSMPEPFRQVHNCNACRKFVQGYGHLVAIEVDSGKHFAAISSLTAGVPDFYLPGLLAMRSLVEKAKVTGPFYSSEKVWGLPKTGTWTHLSAIQDPVRRYREKHKTADQAMAAKRENFKDVVRALSDFQPAELDEAIRILEAGALWESQRYIEPAKWLRRLHDRPRGVAGTNVLWAQTAAAPEGYCHPRAGVLGSLLDDIKAGKPFNEIKDAFNYKVDPARFQRPQAAPSAGNVIQAEKLVEKLGIARSLPRRAAHLNELTTIWDERRTDPRDGDGGSVFGHLKTKGRPTIAPVQLPTVAMTWVKFLATVLPAAEKIDISVPAHGAFAAFTTALNADAPPIFQWDNDEHRNPVSTYTYVKGSYARDWGLPMGWRRVAAVSEFPWLWGANRMMHLGEGVLLVVEGATDLNQPTVGLFPALLKNEFHAIRSTIEAYSNAQPLAGVDDAPACGLIIGKNTSAALRVLSKGAWSGYTIDRWD